MLDSWMIRPPPCARRCGYAVALFDYLLGNAGLMRLSMWQQLERAGAAAAEVDAYRVKVTALAAVHGLDADDGRVLDLLHFTVSIASTWARTVPELRDLGGAARAARLAAHRQSILDDVAAMERTLSLSAKG
jgi:hypothetical protein